MASLELTIGLSANDGYWAEDTSDFSNSNTIVVAGSAASKVYHGFLLFPNVLIPQGSTITAAFIRFVAGTETGTPPAWLTKIYANDVDDAVAVTSAANGNGKALTTAAVDWDETSWTGTEDSPDISAVIQEVVDRAGWFYGNSMQIIWKDDGTTPGTNYLAGSSWDHATDNPPKLFIDFEPPAGVVQESLSTGADDGYAHSSGTFDATATDSYVGDASGGQFEPFFRFQGVDIPQGATILTAALRLTATSLVGTSSSLVTALSANDVDDSTAPTTAAEFNALARTTATVAWAPAAWVNGTSYDSPDLSAVIQEIVDRAGWASGNDLTILWDNTGTPANNRLQFANLEHATATEPRLFITYAVGGDSFMGWGPIPI